MEPTTGIEPVTSSLPRKCSTTELQRLLKSLSQWIIGHWSRFYHWLTDLMTNDNPERKTRFEPATYSLEGCRSTNWATSASQFAICNKQFASKELKCQLCFDNWRRGQGWIRTTELVRGQIYSLLPLATWLLALHLISVLWFWFSKIENPNLKSTEPLVGIEPTTYWLQISCSTSWATLATIHAGISTHRNFKYQKNSFYSPQHVTKTKKYPLPGFSSFSLKKPGGGLKKFFNWSHGLRFSKAASL